MNVHKNARLAPISRADSTRYASEPDFFVVDGKFYETVHAARRDISPLEKGKKSLNRPLSQTGTEAARPPGYYR